MSNPQLHKYSRSKLNKCIHRVLNIIYLLKTKELLMTFHDNYNFEN